MSHAIREIKPFSMMAFDFDFFLKVCINNSFYRTHSCRDISGICYNFENSEFLKSFLIFHKACKEFMKYV